MGKGNNKIVIMLISMLLISTITPLLSKNCSADWNQEDGHKMHFPQLPDPSGWDVHATSPVFIADDWQCSESGEIKDIHFWGSWLHDDLGEISYFNIWIFSDIPVSPSTPFSRPGQVLWHKEITEYTTRGPYQGEQGWYWPELHDWIRPDHQYYYQYNVFLDEEDWFEQEENEIYWLGISAVVEGNQKWGWKSSKDHWNDDGCWSIFNGWDWMDLWEPPYTIVSDQYNAQFSYGNDLVQGGGTGFDGGMWYYYWETEWWNTWFYNEPFYDEKMKRVDIEFIVEPTEPSASITFALNYATPAWPPGQQIPPLPELLEPGQEDEAIQRVILFEGEIPNLIEKSYTYYIREYNPEWVSIDLRGQNFILDGNIQHTCFQSLDLAFVTNGDSGNADITIDKKVSIDGGITWEEVVDAEINENVRFKITFENSGNVDLSNIKIVDTLPSCLEYANNADPIEPSISGNELTWRYSSIAVGSIKEIEFDATPIESGKNVNKVDVQTNEGVSDNDTATVQVGEPGIPDLDCEGALAWSRVKPGSTVTGNIYVKNIGDPDSELNWKICAEPSWGTWTFTPEHGSGLMPSDGLKSIIVSVIAPSNQNQQFSGDIKLCNEDDTTDECIIQVSLATPKIKPLNPIELFLINHPILHQIFNQIILS